MRDRGALLLALGLAVLALAGCRATQVTPTLPPPTIISEAPAEDAATATSALPTSAPTDLPLPTPTLMPSATYVPTPLPSSPVPSATPLPATTATTAPPIGEDGYEVAFVAADDELNVRSGPGVDNSISGTLAPDAQNVTLTGASAEVEGSLWVEIRHNGTQGWVNSRFLTETVPGSVFCGSEEVAGLLSNLEEAIAGENGRLLVELVHPQRGLRVRHDWWNPEIRLSGGEVAQIFQSKATKEWGTEDGSGFAIIGSFDAEIAPLLQSDLVGAAERACNEILHGPTAGMVQLPPGYEGINFYSYHRAPGEEQLEFDWGTWVVGVERWQGQYYVSFLVHYDYEI